MPDSNLRRRGKNSQATPSKQKCKPASLATTPTPTTETTRRHHKNAKIAGAMLILTTIYLYYQQLFPTSKSDRSPSHLVDKYRKDSAGIPSWGYVMGEVEERSWNLLLESDESDDANGISNGVPAFLAQRRLPMIVRASPAKDWPAIRKWNTAAPEGLKYLLNQIPKLRKVRKAEHPVFIYEDYSRILGKDPRFRNIVGRPTQERVDISMKEFLGLASRRERQLKGAFSLYYSHELNHTAAFAAIDTDASPRNWMAIDETNTALGNSNTRLDCEAATGPVSSCATVWMGKPLVCAGAHYDPGHNVFVQVSGRKRFVLMSPEVHSEMHLYPFYHPRDRQAQLELVGEDVRATHSDQNVPSQEDSTAAGLEQDGLVPYIVGDLGPGDMLYLPPYWFHRVTALDAGVSVSVNLWSTSREQLLSDSLTDLPKQLINDDRATPETRAAIATFVTTVIGDFVTFRKSLSLNKEEVSSHTQHGTGKDNRSAALHFIKSLVESRFLYNKNSKLGQGLGCSAFDVGTCPKFGGEISANMQRDVNLASDAIANKLVGFLKTLKASEAERPEITLDVLNMIVGDWVERVVTFGLRDVGKTCHFLRCLSEPSA